ncbi:12496_t:CDS:10, partial [Ambispora leptoticha]
MQEGLIDNRDMPEGRRIKDLVEVIERRKKEIVERKPSQKKSEAEKLNKIGKEAVFFQKQLAERDIILEEDSWANRVLEIIDDKKAMEEKVKQAEGILGLQLKNLEESSPPLTNLSETVNLLPKIGINLKKGENGRNYYDAESLSNKLTELIRKEEENNSLRETIKTKGEEIEQLKNDLDVVKGEKESLTIFFSKKGKDEKVAGWEKKNKELTNSLSNAQKEVEDLQKIIAENANIANKEEQEDLEAIARNLGIEEREVKDKPVEEIQKIIKEKAEQLQRVKNKVEELPNLINADGKVSDDKLEKLKKLIENRENTAKRISELEKDTAKKLSEAEKVLTDEQTEHEKTKTALNAANQDKDKANQIVDEAKEALGTGTTNPEAAKTKIESLDQAAREANAAQAKAATAKTRLDQAEKDRDAYLAALNKAQDKQDKQDKLNNLIDPKDLDQKIKEVRTEYEGFINPKNITPTRQEAGLKTEDEVNVELDKIAHQLGLGNHNDLTDINLANLQAAEKERNNARRSLRTDNLNTLPPIPAGETLQTLLERPTQPELVEAVNNARQQEAEKYTNHIDPHNLEAEAKKAGFGFTQQDIDEAEYKKTEAALTNANNTIVTAQKQLENLQNQLATKLGYNSRPDTTIENYNRILNDQKPGDYDEIKNELERPDIPITKQEWENDYRQRPTPEQLTQAVQKEKDKYSNHISPEKLTTDYIAKDKLEEEAKKQGMVPKEDYDKVVREKNARPDITKADWENDYSKRPKQTDLDQANKIIQDYENDLKIKLGLKNRPTSDNSGEIKTILGLGSTDNLPNDWQNQLVKKDDLVKKENEKAKTVDDLQRELDDLRSKPAGTALTAEQEKKLNNSKKAATGDKLTGKLEIKNYPVLTEIDLGDNEITELIIRNCPNLKKVNVKNNKKLKLLKLDEINLVNGSSVANNLIKGFEELVSLDRIIKENTPIRYLLEDKLKGYQEAKEVVKEIIDLTPDGKLPDSVKTNGKLDKNKLRNELEKMIVETKTPQLKTDKENAEKERDAAKTELKSTKTEHDQLKQESTKIRSELGLGENATLQQILDEINKLKNRPTNGPVCTHNDYDDIKAERDRLKTENTKLKDENKENADIDVITKK